LVLLAIPSSNARAVKWWANIAAFLGFAVSLPLVFLFDRTKDFQFVEQAPCIVSQSEDDPIMIPTKAVIDR